MARKLNSTYNELKRQTMRPRTSVDNLKDVLRKQFRDRLKNLRNDNLNSVRNLTTNFRSLQLLNNLHIESYGLTDIEVMEIIEEVERELEFEILKRQSEENEEDNNAIVEQMLKDVNFCPVCEKVLNQNIQNSMCEQCSNSFI